MWDPRKHEPHIRVLGPAICNEILCNPASSLRVGTVACELDRNLSGQAKLSLVDMLDARAGRLVTLLAEAESEAQATRATGYRALEKRLHAMRDGDD